MLNYFSSISKLYTEPMELAAIWLTRPLITAQGKTWRLAPDALVCIENGELVDCLGEPTHKVIGCFGTLVDQYEVTLINIQTNEPLLLKI